MLNVNEIFCSIEGEGIRAGQLVVFVRLNGCNLRCVYCDTQYAQGSFTAQGTTMSVAEVVEAVEHLAVSPYVTVTGGEPMIHLHIVELLLALASQGFQVNVETNGSIDVTKHQQLATHESVFFTVDYKSLSSGMNHYMFLPMFCKLRPTDVVKCVVSNKADIDDAIAAVGDTPAAKYFSTVFGAMTPAHLVDELKARPYMGWAMQLQLHKYIWDVNKRGV